MKNMKIKSQFPKQQKVKKRKLIPLAEWQKQQKSLKQDKNNVKTVPNHQPKDTS